MERDRILQDVGFCRNCVLGLNIRYSAKILDILCGLH